MLSQYRFFPKAYSGIFLKRSEIRTTNAGDQLTSSSLFNLDCRDGKERDYFNHDFDDHVYHCMIRWNVFIRFEPHNEVIDARKKINKHVLARINILGSLIDAGITMTRKVR